MAEVSLITPELRALIGRASPTATVRITSRAVARAMEVFQDGELPLPPAGAVVPGYVVASLEGERPREDEERSGEHIGLPAALPNTLLVSDEWHFERPLRMGEALHAISRLVDISERLGGRFGHSLYFRSEIEFRDRSGALVARSARTQMQYRADGVFEAPE